MSLRAIKDLWGRLTEESASTLIVDDDARDSLFVLADALNERGYPALAKDLSKFSAQVGRYRRSIRGGGWEPIEARAPSPQEFRSLLKRTRYAIEEMERGRPNVWWLEKRDDYYDRTRGTWKKRMFLHPVIPLTSPVAADVVEVKFLTTGKTLVVGRSDLHRSPPSGKSVRFAPGARRFHNR